jgi:cell shape-determining protein MreD
MALLNKNLKINFFRLGPIFLLYFLSITETDTQFSNLFEILSFNLQLIVIYFWMLKTPSVIGNGHIFFAGIINDVITGLPLGTSSLSYLVVSLVAAYIRSVSVKMTLPTDWFTFGIAVFFSNLTFLVLLSNFTTRTVLYTDLFYNSLFTILFFPFFWLIFNIYLTIGPLGKND